MHSHTLRREPLAWRLGPCSQRVGEALDGLAEQIADDRSTSGHFLAKPVCRDASKPGMCGSCAIQSPCPPPLP